MGDASIGFLFSLTASEKYAKGDGENLRYDGNAFWNDGYVGYYHELKFTGGGGNSNANFGLDLNAICAGPGYYAAPADCTAFCGCACSEACDISEIEIYYR